MPKRPDLIATEMQGDATIPAEIEQAVAEAYQSSKDDPAVVDSLQLIYEEGLRELAGEAPESEAQPVEAEAEAPVENGGNGGETKRGLRRLLSRS